MDALELGYIQTNGPQELREAICQLYTGSSKDNILVTTGSSEANFLLIWSTAEPGDEVIFMLPHYMQMWGLLRGFGASVKPFYLREELNWNPNLGELKRMVTKKTKMIILNNPNNPTGAVLDEEARQTIVDLAEWAGAWIVCDEVYQGAELDGSLTPSFWGMADRVVVTNGLSKAYGLSGLRVGWITGPEDFIQRIWPYHDYTTICLNTMSSRLAQIALANREGILRRTRSILSTNLPILQSWMKKQRDLFHLVPPKAGAIAFARYNLDISSADLVERIRSEKSVLLVPGKHFLMGNYLRFGYGMEKERLTTALDLIGEVLRNIQQDSR